MQSCCTQTILTDSAKLHVVDVKNWKLEKMEFIGTKDREGALRIFAHTSIHSIALNIYSNWKSYKNHGCAYWNAVFAVSSSQFLCVPFHFSTEELKSNVIQMIVNMFVQLAASLEPK